MLMVAEQTAVAFVNIFLCVNYKLMYGQCLNCTYICK